MNFQEYDRQIRRYMHDMVGEKKIASSGAVNNN